MKKFCTLIYFLSILSFAMPPVFADNLAEDKQVLTTEASGDIQNEQKIEAIKPNTEINEKIFEQKEFTKSSYITEELREYIDRALKLNPTLKQRRAETEESFYQNKESRTSLSPQVNFSASYSQSMRQPSRDSTGSFSYGFSLRQYITDFGKTSNLLKVSEESYISSICSLRSAEEDVVYNVKDAYYRCISAKCKVEVNQESYDAYEKHLKEAKAYFEAGTKSKIEVTTAEVNLANAEYSLTESKNAYELALMKLANAIGEIYRHDYDFGDDADKLYKNVIPILTEGIGELLATAKNERPDLMRLESRIRSAGYSLKSVRAERTPSISASAGYNWSGQEYPPDHSWNVGASMSMPILDGGSLTYRIKQAEIRVEQAEASYETSWQNAIYEVQSAFLTMNDKYKNVELTQKTLAQAEENFYLAESRYNVGVGSNLEFIDAQVSLFRAKINRINAITDYYIAIAKLEKAISSELHTNYIEKDGVTNYEEK